MSRKNRRRVKQVVLRRPIPRPLGPRQQMARVNVDDGTWADFRIAGIRVGLSVADYLGQLVTKEVARLRG